jgi:hypothetical protein
MTWTQLGLALGPLPTRFDPKRNPSRSRPIKKVKAERYVTLAEGELDDSLEGIFD